LQSGAENRGAIYLPLTGGARTPCVQRKMMENWVSMTIVPLVLDFWFHEAGPDRWFRPPVEFDDTVLRRFFKLHEQAAAGNLHDWEQTARGSLALCLLLDQFPRNMFRGTARCFATDDDARRVASQAISQGFDTEEGMTDNHRLFFYLPFEHSEDIEDQNRSCELIATLTSIPEYTKWAEAHRAIIERFGRFPHRNDPLGRRSTPEEEEFLQQEESSF
jgi:uncharacterized protein (DUF924 family)